eukprot:COSAG02_NODE_13019_length_1459_cov_1.228676_2_plen_172_part_01
MASTTLRRVAAWGLIEELGKRKTPLDFFSWHAYIDEPRFYAETAANVRRRLDAAGLVAAKQHVTEWFPCILCKTQDTLDGAAAFASSLTNMVNSGVSLATLYPACSLDEGNRQLACLLVPLLVWTDVRAVRGCAGTAVYVFSDTRQSVVSPILRCMAHSPNGRDFAFPSERR